MSLMSKYTMTNAGLNSVNRYIISDADVAKISDLDKHTVKMLFRIIISDLIYLKD